MRKISRTEGVHADSCGSCMHEIKLLTWNTKIHEQIYLLTAGKGLKLKPQEKLLSITWWILSSRGRDLSSRYEMTRISTI